MVRLASIDIGSNAMRLEICEIEKNQLFNLETPLEDIKINPVNFSGGSRVRMPIRLGYEAFMQNYFSKDKIQEVISAFEYFKFELENNKVDFYLTSATSASRESVNGYEIPKLIFEKIGLRYRIIDGRKESQLLNMSLSSFYSGKKIRDVLIDLGGGSLEINVRDSGTVYYQDSLPIGTVRLMIESDFNDEKMVEIINKKLTSVKKFFKTQKIIDHFDYFLAPGGNAEDLALMANRFFNFNHITKDNLIELPLSYIHDILRLIKPIESKYRAFRFNLRPDRADVIFQAGTIFREIGRSAGVETMNIPKANLNDGIIYDLINRIRRMIKLGFDPYFTALAFNNGKN
jgi:exopolyphosphatase/guanosine-5'-triphosphate,3'-diphosphate pyrophosphatase